MFQAAVNEEQGSKSTASEYANGMYDLIICSGTAVHESHHTAGYLGSAKPKDHSTGAVFAEDAGEFLKSQLGDAAYNVYLKTRVKNARLYL